MLNKTLRLTQGDWSLESSKLLIPCCNVKENKLVVLKRKKSSVVKFMYLKCNQIGPKTDITEIWLNCIFYQHFRHVCRACYIKFEESYF